MSMGDYRSLVKQEPVFEKAAPKTLKKMQKKRTYVHKFPFDKSARIQSTAYWTKNSALNTFLEVLRKDRVF